MTRRYRYVLAARRQARECLDAYRLALAIRLKINREPARHGRSTLNRRFTPHGGADDESRHYWPAAVVHIQFLRRAGDMSPLLFASRIACSAEIAIAGQPPVRRRRDAAQRDDAVPDTMMLTTRSAATANGSDSARHGAEAEMKRRDADACLPPFDLMRQSTIRYHRYSGARFQDASEFIYYETGLIRKPKSASEHGIILLLEARLNVDKT